jgi:hypothetical protein
MAKEQAKERRRVAASACFMALDVSGKRFHSVVCLTTGPQIPATNIHTWAARTYVVAQRRDPGFVGPETYTILGVPL